MKHYTLIILLLFVWQNTALCETYRYKKTHVNARTTKSEFDKEREQAKREAARERAREDIQEAKQDRRENNKEALKAQREALFADDKPDTDSKKYFYNNVMGKYALKDGKVLPLKRIEGKITKIADSKSILISPQLESTTAGVTLPPVLLSLSDTSNLSEGTPVSYKDVVENGTFDYSWDSGPSIPVKVYIQAKPMTYKEYLEIKGQ